jgi:hypothetical protein
MHTKDQNACTNQPESVANPSVILSQIVDGCVSVAEAVFHECQPVKVVGLRDFVFARVSDKIQNTKKPEQ